jgi:hypothetical protein
MIAALLLQIAVALCITVPNTAVVLVFISLSGVTKGLFDPSALGLQRAVFVDATVRQRQVFATFVELNWGLSSLVGVPLCGLLLGVDFRAPFWAVAAAVAAMLPCLVLVLRGVGDLHADGAGKRRRTTNTDAVGRAAHAKDGRVGHADGAAAAAAAAAPSQVRADMEMAARGLAPQALAPPGRADSITPATHASDAATAGHRCCSCSCRRLRSVARSRRTLSNFLDAFFCATTMGMKDVVFGLWLAKIHNYDESAVAGAAVVLGLADISGEVLLTLLLLKNNCVSAEGMAIPTWLCTAGSVAFFWAASTASATSATAGLVAVYLMSTCMEMKAVQCLSVAATTDEDGLDGGLPEIACYSGTNIGFAAGTVLAPLLWESGGAAAFGAAVLAVAVLAVLAKGVLYVCATAGTPASVRKA